MVDPVDSRSKSLHLTNRGTALLLVISTILFCAPAIAAGAAPHHQSKRHRSGHHTAQSVLRQHHRRRRRTKHKVAAEHGVAAATGTQASQNKRHKPKSSGTPTIVTTSRTPTATTPTATTVKTTPTGTTTTTSTTDPSGQAMPTGNLAGWNEVFSDNFTESSLNPSIWNTYWGQPGGDPGGWWDPSHVYTQNGRLVLAAYKDPAYGGKWVSGGVSSSPGFSQTHGKYLVRFRMDPGQGLAHTISLWPASNAWPPEVDFSEDNGSDRQTDTVTEHYGANNTQVRANTAVNLTQWHTLGVEWTPGKLVYTLDGSNWATMANPEVPSVPMALDLQTQAWSCGISNWEVCPNALTPANVNLDVDWVVAYSMA